MKPRRFPRVPIVVPSYGPFLISQVHYMNDGLRSVTVELASHGEPDGELTPLFGIKVRLVPA